MNKRLKILACIVFCLATGIVAWFFWLKPEVTLIDLQKQYLLAKTDEEKERVIDRVEEYYLNLDVPDSIRLHVEAEVQLQIDTTQIVLADCDNSIFEKPNPYKQENQLQELLKLAMIAKARHDEHLFGALMAQAKRLAKVVDERTENDYWVGFVDGVSQYDVRNALAWLRANKSLKFLRDTMDINFRVGENYGTLGLYYLHKLSDNLLRLNILQRIQSILYISHGLNELSIGLGEHILKQAKPIGDLNRVAGVTYYQAEALNLSGEVETALNSFRETTKYADLCGASYYKKIALIQTAICYWQLGEFESALLICDEIEQLPLTPMDRMQVHSTKGLAYQGLGSYEMAELELEKAMQLAIERKTIFNEIRCLSNLGNLFFDLTEYDRALDYLNRASSRQMRFNPENYEERINLLLDRAKVMAQKDQRVTVDSLRHEAFDLLNGIGDNPFRKADLMATIAGFKLQQGDLKNALSDLVEAEAVCRQNGLYRMGLKYQIRIAKCLVESNKFLEAQKKIDKALFRAGEIDYAEMQVEALSLRAEIAHKQGNLQKAIAESNQLLSKVQTIRSGFQNPYREMAFQQKVYNHLKCSALYDIYDNNITGAFLKIGLEKARVHTTISDTPNETSHNRDRKKEISRLQKLLNPQTLLIDYLVTDDSLYVFALGQQELNLFKRAVPKERLKKQVKQYKKLLRRTIAYFDDYNPTAAQQHFQNTVTLSATLYENLLGWLLSNPCYHKIKQIYIIPDEFLFELPFATLITRSGELRFLGQDYALALASSSQLLRKSEHLSEFHLENPKVLASIDTNIPGGKDFLNFLEKQFPALEILSTKKELSKDAMLAQLEQPNDILILFGHGQADAVFPERSFINFAILQETAGEVQNMQITLADLDSIKTLGAKMVLLIGCETGDGKLYRGSGIAGLQQGLLAHGADYVLASLWQIDAANTIEQMAEFLQNLQMPLTPAYALQQMQNRTVPKLRQNKFYDNPHPYLWGSYTLYSTAIH